MKKMIEHLKKDLNRFHFILYEMVSYKDYKFVVQDLEGFIAEVKTYINECENGEDITKLLQIKQTAEAYKERAKGLQELYCSKKKDKEEMGR